MKNSQKQPKTPFRLIRFESNLEEVVIPPDLDLDPPLDLEPEHVPQELLDEYYARLSANALIDIDLLNGGMTQEEIHADLMAMSMQPSDYAELLTRQAEIETELEAAKQEPDSELLF